MSTVSVRITLRLLATTYFISDLHLSDAYPESVSVFIQFLNRVAAPNTQLYILGDFFDAWVGLDEESTAHQVVVAALRAAEVSGLKTYFMMGNRDFLLNHKDCKKLFMHAIPDPFLFESGQHKILLMHGDGLCSDDKNYMRYRKIVRIRFFAWLFSFLPLSLRRWVGEKMRGASEQQNQRKNVSIMDVNRDAVIQAMNQFNTQILIHGHTHKSGKHRYQKKGSVLTRLVLGAWHQEAKILKLDETGLRFETLRIQN